MQHAHLFAYMCQSFDFESVSIKVSLKLGLSLLFEIEQPQLKY